MRPSTRFSFDIGSTSIGWAVLTTGPGEAGEVAAKHLLDCGVRLFDDSRDRKQQSLAVERRLARSIRRNRDRFRQRRRDLLNIMTAVGLFPAGDTERAALHELDPYRLRAEALSRRLEPHELGRVLFHMNQRRGFKSNRKTESKDTDQKKVAQAAKDLSERIEDEGARTYGEWLWFRHGGTDGQSRPRSRKSTRVRRNSDKLADKLYDFYPLRAMLEAEFDKIIEVQRPHHGDILTDKVVAKLRHKIFHQRPLKPQPRGKCTLVPTEERLDRALPSVEARVIYQTVNEIRWGEHLTADTPLSREQRDSVAETLLSGRNVTFNQLRRLVGCRDAALSCEHGNKKDLKDYSSKTSAVLAKATHFGDGWHSLSLVQKDDIVRRLAEDDDMAALVTWLRETHGLTTEAAELVADYVPASGTSNLGPTANAAVLEELIADQITYSEAVARAGWHHSDFRDGEILNPLPYYGRLLERQVAFGTGNPEDDDEKRYGKVANPTVHRCLRQLQRVVNGLVEIHGEPEQIVIELARDLKLSPKQKSDLRKRQSENAAANEERRKVLASRSLMDTPDNLMRLRLHEEQAAANENGVALCPYSLEPITLDMLFTDEVEVEHILPRSQTLDDGVANKVIALRRYNRDKGSRTPHEAFSHLSNWSDIEEHAKRLPKNKSWRFGSGAMDRFLRDHADFAARHLNDTRYASRLAREYLSKVCDPNQVYVSTGQFTAMARARWSLNGILSDDNHKTRDDNRHHAIDAIVVGCLDRSVLQKMARRSARVEAGDPSAITEDLEQPIHNMRDVVREAVSKVICSQKPDHSKAAELHEAGVYGVVRDEAEAAEIGNLVDRKAIESLTRKQIQSVRDPHLRARLEHVASMTGGDDLATRLAEFGLANNIKRVRVGKVRAGAKQTARGHVIDAGVHHVDIVQLRDGSWKMFSASYFDVNQPDFRPSWERDKVGGKLVMRLHSGDLIEIDGDKERQIMKVHQLNPTSNRLVLAAHNESNVAARVKAKELSWLFGVPSNLQKWNARKVIVNSVGKKQSARSNVLD